MRFTEIMIIYLAAAAPVGVAHFMRRASGYATRPALAHALGAATLWPLTLGLRWLRLDTSQRATNAPVSATDETVSDDATTEHRRSDASLLDQDIVDEAAQAHTAQLDGAQQAARQALYEVEDAVRVLPAAVAVRQLLGAVGASLERYAGLGRALCCAPAGDHRRDQNYQSDARKVDSFSDESSCTPGEVELCRLANRSGDDLRLAARCFRRRHHARLRAHHIRARCDLLRSLDELHEQLASPIAWPGHALTPREQTNGNSCFSALVRFDDHAVNLCSLLEDEAVARRIAQSLETTCARLRAHRANADIVGAAIGAQTAQRL